MLFLLQVAFDAFACYAKSLAIALLFFFPSLFLGRMANVFANVLWFVTQEPCNQERAYINDMPCAYIPCALEIYSNGGVKQEHVESCPSTTKNISTTTMPMASKLWGWWLTLRDNLPIKLHDALITWSCKITW